VSNDGQYILVKYNIATENNKFYTESSHFRHVRYGILIRLKFELLMGIMGAQILNLPIINYRTCMAL
jgi:hypothetical protein